MIQAKHQKSYIGSILCICFLLLVGCETTYELGEIRDTTLAITEEGEVTYYLTEDFEKDYYNIVELSSMANEEVRAYNEQLGRVQTQDQAVQVLYVEKLASNSKKVVICYQFLEANLYENFTGQELFFGTVAQALAQGYDLNVTLIDLKHEDRVLSSTQLQTMTEWKLIIAQGDAPIFPPAKVRYISVGAIMGDDHLVKPPLDDQYTYLLWK
ncbi:MAG: hypothetical protein LBM60_05340 [Clostridium sp.]|jgi:hypothetical protein|nr:hypothetical protein [Clostridium sp.]